MPKKRGTKGTPMLGIYLRLLDTEEEQTRFRQLYEKYRNPMFYTAKEIFKDDCPAENAAHRAFIRIALQKMFLKSAKFPVPKRKISRLL